MGKELKVLMMGGARVGKSSALAAIMESFITGPSRYLLSAQDKTNLEKKDGEKQASIESKLKDAKEMLSKYNGKIILVDSGKTNNIWSYHLELSVPDSNDSMSITFTDINGEFFAQGNFRQDEVINLIKDYEVFIVAIDTAFMMESRNVSNKLVNSVINDKYNCISSIHTFLCEIDDNEGKDAKLVIFTPIKCEKWAQENKLDDVVKCVQEDYSTPLKALKAFKNIQIEILPIQTIGSMVFVEHCEAYKFRYEKPYLLFFTKEHIAKCAILPENSIRLSDGSFMKYQDGKILDDESAVMIEGSGIIRPNSWFKVQSSDYKPHNCEQLAYHILEFMLSKVIDAKVRKKESENRFISGILNLADRALNFFTIGLWNKLKDVFGSISIEKMSSIIDNMNKMNMIKREGEGIYILKKSNFKKL